jgi:hypothetical protein
LLLRLSGINKDRRVVKVKKSLRDLLLVQDDVTIVTGSLVTCHQTTVNQKPKLMTF